MFEDKIRRNSLSDNESSKRSDQNSNHLEPFSFSALHFLRNRLMPTDLSHCYNLSPHSSAFSSQSLQPLESMIPLPKISMQSKISSGSEFSSNSSPRLALKSPNSSPSHLKSPMGLSNNPQSIFCSTFLRRPRGEKRPIPEEQKDEKYFERRKRNNEAAKKSRDARKMREDRIALRAALLEQENSILRAQTIALREEVCTLRQILCNSRALTSTGLSAAQV